MVDLTAGNWTSPEETGVGFYLRSEYVYAVGYNLKRLAAAARVWLFGCQTEIVELLNS